MDEDRIERMVAALAHASMDDFSSAMAQLRESGHDTLGALEEALRLFISRLSSSTVQNSEALAALAAAKADADERLRIIERQQTAMLEMQAPVIDVWPGILMLPLLGVIDSQRVSFVIEHVLTRVTHSGRVKWVIVDLTGVSGIDGVTAQYLLRLSQAVRLLGVQCILTGIGSDLARVLVDSSTSLSDLRSLRSLREGLAYCINQSNQR